MVQVRIESKRFLDFLQITDMEYVDVFIAPDTMVMINNSEEIFGMMQFQAKVDAGDVGRTFRLVRSVMQKLYTPGIITFEFAEQNVAIGICGKAPQPIWRFSIKQQDPLSFTYKDKVDLCKELNEYNSVELTEILPIVRYMKPFKSMITIENGLVTGFVNSRVRICKKISIKDAFTINSVVLSKVISLNTKVIRARTFLAARNENLTVLATLCTPMHFTDFDYLEEQGSALKCNIYFGNIAELFKKIDFKTENVELDLMAKTLKLEKDRVTYTIPILLKDLEVAKGYAPEKISIEIGLFKNLLTRIGNQFNLSQKKSCIRLEASDTIIYL